MDFATATTQPAADSVESDCNPTQAWLGWVRLGMAWQARHGPARPGKARSGTAGQARLGSARSGGAWQGTAGKAWPGMARLGRARHGRQSTNRSDRAGYKWIANNKQK